MFRLDDIGRQRGRGVCGGGRHGPRRETGEVVGLEELEGAGVGETLAVDGAQEWCPQYWAWRDIARAAQGNSWEAGRTVYDLDAIMRKGVSVAIEIVA